MRRDFELEAYLISTTLPCLILGFSDLEMNIKAFLTSKYTISVFV